MIQLKDIDRELAEILLDNIINKHWKLTYREIATELSKRLGREVNPHYGLRTPLGVVSSFCFDLGLPLISARVIYSGPTSNQVVGEGFYTFACEFRPEYKKMTPEEAWTNEIKLIRECKDWQRLREFLDGASVDEILGREHLTPGFKEIIEENDFIGIPISEPNDYTTEPVFPSEPNDYTTEPVFPDEISDTIKQKEGAIKTVQVSVHERNPSLRKQCLEHYGTSCAVCEVDMGSLYGDEFSGKIHVHHLNPISEFDEEHDVNPINDLRPVCPNCHMIIHCGRDKPYSIEEVKQMLNRK